MGVLEEEDAGFRVAGEDVEGGEVGEGVDLEGGGALAGGDESEIAQRVQGARGHRGRDRVLPQERVEQRPRHHRLQRRDHRVHDLLEELPERGPRPLQDVGGQDRRLRRQVHARQRAPLPALRQRRREAQQLTLRLEHGVWAPRVLRREPRQPRQRPHVLDQRPGLEEREGGRGGRARRPPEPAFGGDVVGDGAQEVALAEALGPHHCFRDREQ